VSLGPNGQPERSHLAEGQIECPSCEGIPYDWADPTWECSKCRGTGARSCEVCGEAPATSYDDAGTLPVCSACALDTDIDAP
jgi:hypothetical protein